MQECKQTALAIEKSFVILCVESFIHSLFLNPFFKEHSLTPPFVHSCTSWHKTFSFSFCSTFLSGHAISL